MSLIGTNYEAVLPPCANACEHCAAATTLHIGKSSGGWKFGFQAHRDRGLVSWQSWQALLAQPGVRIVDEYGESLTLEEFTRVVNRVDWVPRGDGRPLSCRIQPDRWTRNVGYGGRWEPDDRYFHDAAGYDFYDGEFS